MINKKSLKAFSLIELSIVILVIGILVAGVMQGVDMVRKSQLQTAKNLTTSSPVSGVKDLMLWYETSLTSSFISTEGVDNTAISTWYDNSTQKPIRNNATQGNSLTQPKFYDNVFGGIPAIRFDGTNDNMGFDGTFLISVNYTIFVVEQRRITGNRYFIGCGTPTITNACFALGYRTDSSVGQSHYGNDLNSDPFPSYSHPIPRIHTFWFSKTVGKRYWYNGGINYDKNNGQTGALIANPGASIGSTEGGNYYNGDLAEIIMFTRDLKNEERQAIESYLSKKYNIAIVE